MLFYGTGNETDSKFIVNVDITNYAYIKPHSYALPVVD